MNEEINVDLEKALDLIADLIHQSKTMVAFTGAGISTESGIPDFRSPGGIWSKYDPRELTFQKFLASEEVRKIRWKMFMEMDAVWNAKPNAAHVALADLYNMGKLKAVITQNIDGLHQDAGLPADKVIEIHWRIIDKIGISDIYWISISCLNVISLNCHRHTSNCQLTGIKLKVACIAQVDQSRIGRNIILFI